MLSSQFEDNLTMSSLPTAVLYAGNFLQKITNDELLQLTLANSTVLAKNTENLRNKQTWNN